MMTLSQSVDSSPGAGRLRLAPRCLRALAALLIALGAWLLFSHATASAAVTHKEIGTFTGADAPSGPFILPVTIAADTTDGPNSGDVFLGGLNMSFASSVARFDADGVYDGLELTSTPLGPFSLLDLGTFALGTIAIDNSEGANQGALYLADQLFNVVHRFLPDGSYDCAITGSSSPSANECDDASPGTPTGSLKPSGLAVDGDGNLYVSDSASKVVYVFDPAGGYMRQIADATITAPGPLALDSSGNLYVVNRDPLVGGTTLVKFDADGNFVATVSDKGVQSVAVDPSTDHIYVGEDGPRHIAQYDPAGNLVTTFAPAELGVGVDLAVGSNGYVYVPQGDGVHVFGPLVVIPDVSTESATDIGQTTAILRGTVDPDTQNGGGQVTDCYFEYGTSDSYGQTAPCSPATPYDEPTAVSAALEGLTPATTYHFRIVAENADGSSLGEDRTFTTTGPPVIDALAPLPQTTRAEVKAQINPFGLETECEVEWVSDADHASTGFANAESMPCSPASLEPGFGKRMVRAKITGLEPDTTYHYRFVARNDGGTTTSAGRTFTTWGISEFSVEVTDREGEPYTQAGGHPYRLITRIELNTSDNDDPNSRTPSGTLKDVIVSLPPGLIGNPTATPRCSEYAMNLFQCSPDSQVGRLAVGALAANPTVPLFNVETLGKAPAKFGGAISLSTNAYLTAKPRTGSDYGIDAMSLNITGLTPVTRVTVEMWGVPADRSNDSQRYCPPAEGAGSYAPPPCPTAAVPKPFLTMPTSCTGTQVAKVKVISYEDQNNPASATDTLPATTGCEKLHFTPTIDVAPEERRVDTPTGLSVDLRVPQNDNADGVASANLKDATVVLPEGMSVAPGAADGMKACSPGQIGLDSEEEPSCPKESKIGSVEIESPLVPVPLKGGIYQAEQNNNPFNDTLAIYLVAEAHGALIKLAGHIEADPETGQLRTTFKDNPQLPFSHLRLHFFGGPRAALATPPTCGIYKTRARFVPWSAADPDDPQPDEIVTDTSTFVIDKGPDGGPCQAGDPSEPGDPADLADRPFEPEMKAGVKNPVAGSFTPFTFQLKRQDGHQEILSAEVTPPEGVTARLAGIPLCSEADAEAASCGPESKVGTAITGAGAGTNPFYIQTGSVHLAGPYDPDQGGPAKRAPLSLLISVPAVAGPFDLGVVNVRAAVYVDPTTAQLRVVSDPIPQILEGIPLRVRDIRIRMDRDRFTIAPTDCTETQVKGKAFGSHGAEADLQNRFQVGECASLGFKPSLKFQATGGKKATKRNAHPGLKANLIVPGADAYSEGAERGSQANIKRVQVTLPKGLFLDQASPALVDPCTREEYEEGDCPASSKVGTAIAHTPLLDEPLKGPVYLRTSDNPLPDLVADLNGIVDIDLVGAVSQANQRIRNTFQIVPDVPVSSFELRLAGGAKGLLVNSNTGKGLCGKGRRQINVAMRAHNGRTHAYKTQMKARCPKPKKKKGKGKKKAKRAAARAARGRG